MSKLQAWLGCEVPLNSRKKLAVITGLMAHVRLSSLRHVVCAIDLHLL